MAIKLKHKKDDKKVIVARNVTQARAIIKAGFEPATKADQEKLNPKK